MLSTYRLHKLQFTIHNPTGQKLRAQMFSYCFAVTFQPGCVDDERLVAYTTHGHLPGAAATASVLLELSPTSVDAILGRAADRTCRLVVFKEVHLVSTPSLQASFECVH